MSKRIAIIICLAVAVVSIFLAGFWLRPSADLEKMVLVQRSLHSMAEGKNGSEEMKGAAFQLLMTWKNMAIVSGLERGLLIVALIASLAALGGVLTWKPAPPKSP